MGLIDKSYFFTELLVPNANIAGGPVAEELDNFIAKYEPQFLRYALGFELYQAFKAGYVDPKPQRWVDLVSGVSYTDQGGRSYLWKGLAPIPDAGLKQSPIAMYVYFYFTQNRYTQTAAMGEVSTKNENSVVANPGAKMARAWGEMAEWMREMAYFLNTKRDIYPEWNSQRLYAMLEYFRPVNEFNI